MLQILLLDDESELREEVADYLRARGCEVTEVGSVRQFRQYVPHRHFDILVIDRMLPDGDGLELVESLRESGETCGIVVFSARDASKDRIEGYDRGADHYLTKPVRMDELRAVIETLGKRVSAGRGWRLDLRAWTLSTAQGVSIRLTAMESSFLASLARVPGRPAARAQIVQAMGRDPVTYDARNLDALVLRLRRKVLDASGEALPVRAVHGAGYCLTLSFVVDGD